MIVRFGENEIWLADENDTNERDDNRGDSGQGQALPVPNCTENGRPYYI